MTYEEARAWLYGLFGHGVKLGLRNIGTLLEDLDHPELAAPHVLVAGTNGKGSVATLAGSVLSARGLRVGTYTSPHLVRFEERIRVDGVPIGRDRVAELASRVRGRTEALLASGALESHPTFFELTTAMAWLAFAARNTEVVVAEVGLGGRFDATNCSSPCASAITTVGLEHTRFLGPTVEDIAGEKAGVMRRERPAVTGSDDPGVLEVLRREAARRGARLSRMQETVAIDRIDVDPAGASLEFETENARYGPLRLPLPGRHQVDNARVALALLEALPASLRPAPEEVVRGFESVRWPGRLQSYPGRPRMLLDGAHNPHAATSLAEYLREFEPGRKTLVFASLQDKDVGSMAKLLLPLFDAVVLTRVDNPHALPTDAMRGLVPHGARLSEVEDVPRAIAKARELAGPDGLVVVAGSLYLVGEAQAVLDGESEGVQLRP